MSFLARLRPELVHVAPPWRTFGATVTGLVDSLVSAGTLDAEVRDDAVRAVMTREDESSTALLEAPTLAERAARLRDVLEFRLEELRMPPGVTVRRTH